MSARSAPPSSIARAAALVLSIGLGLFVVVNAQFGCDAPASSPPADEPAKVEAASAEPATAVSAEPATAVSAEAEPASGAGEAAPTVEPAANPGPNANPASNADEAPVFMPASKSGGDFGAMHFPGQGKSGKQDKPANANAAPQQAPTQQQQAGDGR